MELPKFKLSLSGIYSKKDTSNSLVYDENVDPKAKHALSERKLPSPATELKHPFTPQVNRRQLKDSPELKPSLKFPGVRVTSQPTDLLLLQLDTDSKTEESILTIDENSLSLDNQEFYGKECQKRRMISKLDLPFDRDRKMSQTLNEFLKTSTEIKKELKEKQLSDTDRSVFEGSLTQALSPHFPTGTPQQFSKHATESEAVNEMLVRKGFKGIENENSGDPKYLFKLLKDVLSQSSPEHPVPLVFTRDVFISPEDTEIFQHLFGRKANSGSMSEHNILKVISFYHAQVLARDEEMKEMRKELQSRMHIYKTLERDSKKSGKMYSEKVSLMDKTNAELKAEIAELKAQTEKLHIENERLMKDRRGKSPLRSGSATDSQGILEEICKILAIKHTHHILQSVSKLEQVVRAVPKLEKFIREVCTYLFPSLKDENLKREYSSNIDFLSRKFKEQVSELGSLRAFKASVCHFLNVGHQTADEDLLQRLAQHPVTDESEFTQHFRQVFELREDQDIFEAVSQIFLQNHELKAFSRNLRQCLSVNEDSSLSSLLLLVKQLKRPSR